MNRELDFLNLMSYDLHGHWDPRTGHHAGLFKLSGEEGLDATLNVVCLFIHHGYKFIIRFLSYN